MPMSDHQRITLEPVFVLHSRPYSNTSLIVELFSMRFGRVAVMARSARGLKSRFKGKLQLFTPILASWSGKFELKHLNAIELNGLPYGFEHSVLVCGFYLNELLMKFLRHDDPYQHLYQRYQDTLNAMEQGQPLQPVLRYFEKHLLDELGYGLPFKREAISGEPIHEDFYYRYLLNRGFVRVDTPEPREKLIFSGNMLINLHRESLQDDNELLQAKRLMRTVINEHLDGRQLNSRELMT